MALPLVDAAKASLNLIEMFSSVQGETSFAGLPTFFVRLAACNLRCAWCDTTYSFGRGVPHEIEEILKNIRESGCLNVCVTGGEPLLQKDVHLLMTTLCNEGFGVSLETSGSLTIKEVDPRVFVILDVKCPDSKMSDRNYWPNLDLVQTKDEIKFVINSYTDFIYAKEICEKHKLFARKIPVLFSPVFGVLDPKDLVQWILQDKLPARLNMQVHKFIWSPTERGV